MKNFLMSYRTEIIHVVIPLMMTQMNNQKWIVHHYAKAFQNDIYKLLNTQTRTTATNKDINELNSCIVNVIKQAEQINCAKINQKDGKLSRNTSNMMNER